MLYHRRRTGKKGGQSFADLGAASPRLRTLAQALNAVRRGPHGSEKPGDRLKRRILGPDAREVLEGVAAVLLSKGAPNGHADTIAMWRELAHRVPVTLEIDTAPDGTLQPVMMPLNADRGTFALFLEAWDLMVREATHLHRAKRCPACLTWFVDDTRGARKDYCRDRCRQRLKKQRRAARLASRLGGRGRRGSR